MTRGQNPESVPFQNMGKEGRRWRTASLCPNPDSGDNRRGLDSGVRGGASGFTRFVTDFHGRSSEETACRSRDTRERRTKDTMMGGASGSLVEGSPVIITPYIDSLLWLIPTGMAPMKPFRTSPTIGLRKNLCKNKGKGRQSHSSGAISTLS